MEGGNQIGLYKFDLIARGIGFTDNERALAGNALITEGLASHDFRTAHHAIRSESWPETNVGRYFQGGFVGAVSRIVSDGEAADLQAILEEQREMFTLARNYDEQGNLPPTPRY